MKKLLLAVGIVLGIFTVLAGLLFWGLKYDEYKMNVWYVTEDVADYGRISHNGDNGIPKEFIFSFFPEQIEPYFENVEYKYQARDYCDYCCEIYLEFTIDDPQVYQDHVEKATKEYDGQTFLYDPKYIDHKVEDTLIVDEEDHLSEESGYYLDGAKMGRILVCEEQQKIIYTAIMVANCCGTDTENLDFYSRFDIDPLEYAKMMG